MMPKNFYIIAILFLLISFNYGLAQEKGTSEVRADEAKNAAGEQISAGDASKAVTGESKNMSTGAAVSKEVPVSEEEKQKSLKEKSEDAVANEVIAEGTGFKFTSNDLSNKIGEVLPPAVPRFVLNADDKYKIAEDMVMQKIISLELSSGAVSSNAAYKEKIDSAAKEEAVKQFFKGSGDKDLSSGADKIKKLLNDYQVKTNEAVLIKIDKILTMPEKDLNEAVFNFNGGAVTLKNIKEEYNNTPVPSGNQLNSAEFLKSIAYNLLCNKVAEIEVSKSGAHNTVKADKSSVSSNLDSKVKENWREFVMGMSEVSSEKYSDKAKKDYYNKNKENFMTDSKIKVSHILLNDETSANQLFKQLTSKNFADMARKYSMDTVSASLGGDLGFLLPGSFMPDAAGRLATAEVGTILPVLKNGNNFEIIKVTGREEAKVISYSAASSSIDNALSKDDYEKKLNEKIQALKNKYNVLIYKDRIK